MLPIEAVEQLVIPALEQIGTCWYEGSVALSQVYMSGRFCEELIDRVLAADSFNPAKTGKSISFVINSILPSLKS